MPLIESSAWVEFLRDTGSPTCNRVDELLEGNPDHIIICDAVRMEILAGARDNSGFAVLTDLLARAVLIPTLPTDYDDAAVLSPLLTGGETVRKLIDCLIAAVALRAGIPGLHNDRDFDILVRHTGLQAYSVDA